MKSEALTVSNLFDAPVHASDGSRVGWVVDVRLHCRDDRLELAGIIVSPHTTTSFMGYERSDMRAPWLIAAFLRWRHRGVFLVLWRDIADVGADTISLREGFTRYSARFDRRRRRPVR